MNAALRALLNRRAAYDPLGTPMGDPLSMARSLTDIPVIVQPMLRDGRVILAHDAVMVGTRPRTLLEEVGREARLAVRQGYADAGVLGWLGEEVNNEPTGEEVLAGLRATAAPRADSAA